MIKKLILPIFLILLVSSQSASAFLPLAPNNIIIDSTPAGNVVDIYDTTIGDYSTPSTAYASSSLGSSIALDTKNSHNSGVAATKQSMTVVVGNNNDRDLIMEIMYNGNSFYPVSSVNDTTDNKLFTFVNASNTAFGQGYNVEVWQLSQTSGLGTGNKTIVVNLPSAQQVDMGLISLYNVNQTHPISSHSFVKRAGNTGTSANPSLSIKPLNSGSWIIGGIADVNTITASSQTELWRAVGVATDSYASEYTQNPTIASPNTLSWTATSANWAGVAFEVITSTSPSSPLKAVDNLLTTEWQSKSESHPYIVADMGSSNIISGLAIYPDTTNTNCTQIQIQTSNDNATWNIKRTVNINLLSNSTWQFVRWDLDYSTERWIKNYCTDSTTNNVLTIVELKALMPSSTTLLLRHGHEPISSTDGTVPLSR